MFTADWIIKTCQVYQASERNESGDVSETRLYESVQQAGDATSFLHYFAFEDEAARDRHSNSDGVKRFTSILYPELLAPVEFTEYTLVASTAKPLP